jgi:hypothetical protein
MEMTLSKPDAECAHWFDPGLSDIESRHWMPSLTAEQLGLDRPKLVRDDAGEMTP